MTTETTDAPSIEAINSPVLLQYGFRPFFLGAGLWACAASLLWLSAFHGYLSIPTAFDPIGWHVHEMLFGFVAAVIAGFLLTAIPNWTGREPLRGAPLAVLLGAWVLGRCAVASSAMIGGGVAAVIDLSFPALLFGVVVREIVAGKNWRNLPVPFAIAGLFTASALSHADALNLAPVAEIGQRLGIGIVIALINLIGGRIIPAFTGNWLKRRGETAMPAPVSWFDQVCLVLVAVALAIWVAAPEETVAAIALIAAGLASLIRLSRWRGHRTLVEPLVWSLHAGFVWVPAGLLLMGLGLLWPVIPPTAGLHALTAGAMGAVTLAVMTRATLGHTGHALSADAATTAIYALAAVAACCRVAAAFPTEAQQGLLIASGLIWAGAFGLFAVHYGRILTAR